MLKDLCEMGPNYFQNMKKIIRFLDICVENSEVLNRFNKDFCYLKQRKYHIN